MGNDTDYFLELICNGETIADGKISRYNCLRGTISETQAHQLFLRECLLEMEMKDRLDTRVKNLRLVDE